MRHNRRLRWAAIPIAASLAIVLAGCTQAQLNGFLPGFVEGEQPVTNHTERISGLWVTSWIVLLVVGLLWLGLPGQALLVVMVGLGFLLALGWRPSGRVPTILRGHEAPPRS